MRVKFEILSDDSVDEVDSDYDGREYIKVKREDNKLIVVVTVPLEEIQNGDLY